jgi:16S rRNA (uracil1498-N3)-methyltransferase
LAHLLTDLERQHIFEVVVLVGPEGGFTPEEVQAAAQGGFTLVNLGERRLRAETAAIVASALVLALCDSPR